MAKVLVADNDPGVRGLLCEVVRRQGLVVEAVADGEAAQAALDRCAYDVLVCDLDMPRRTGNEVLAWLATRPSPPAVLVVSGYIDARIHAQLTALPFVRAVLRKPFDVIEFAQQVLAVARAAVPAATASTSATGGVAAAADAAADTAGATAAPAVPSAAGEAAAGGGAGSCPPATAVGGVAPPALRPAVGGAQADGRSEAGGPAAEGVAEAGA